MRDVLGSLAYFGIIVGAAYPTFLAVGGLRMSSTATGFWKQFKNEVIVNCTVALLLDVSLLYLALRSK